MLAVSVVKPTYWVKIMDEPQIQLYEVGAFLPSELSLHTIEAPFIHTQEPVQQAETAKKFGNTTVHKAPRSVKHEGQC